MKTRVKQIVIDTLRDGTPHAVRLHYSKIYSEDDIVPAVKEIPFEDLDRLTKNAVKNMLKKAPALVDQP